MEKCPDGGAKKERRKKRAAQKRSAEPADNPDAFRGPFPVLGGHFGPGRTHASAVHAPGRFQHLPGDGGRCVAGVHQGGDGPEDGAVSRPAPDRVKADGTLQTDAYLGDHGAEIPDEGVRAQADAALVPEPISVRGTQGHPVHRFRQGQVVPPVHVGLDHLAEGAVAPGLL